MGGMPFDAGQQYIDGFNESMQKSQQAQHAVERNPDKFAQDFNQRHTKLEGKSSIQGKLGAYTEDLARMGIIVQGNTIRIPGGTNLNFNDTSTIQISRHTGDIFIHDGPDTVGIMSNGNITVNGNSIYKTNKQDNPGNIEQPTKFREFSNDVKSTLLQTVGVRVEGRSFLLPDGTSIPSDDNTKAVSVIRVQSAKIPNGPESVLLRVENMDKSFQVLTFTRNNSNNTLQIDAEKNGNIKTIYRGSSLQNIKW